MLIYLSMIESDDDRSKFEIIYREYRDLMLYIANQILGDTRDSEDVVHESFVKLIGVLDKVKEAKSHKTRSLCVTIVERTAIDLYRRRQRERAAFLDEEYINVPDAARTGTAADHVDLAAAIASLPARYREVLLLRYDNGFSTREIAGMLSISEDNVRKTMQRAKERLGRMLVEGGAGQHADHR